MEQLAAAPHFSKRSARLSRGSLEQGQLAALETIAPHVKPPPPVARDAVDTEHQRREQLERLRQELGSRRGVSNASGSHLPHEAPVREPRRSTAAPSNSVSEEGWESRPSRPSLSARPQPTEPPASAAVDGLSTSKMNTMEEPPAAVHLTRTPSAELKNKWRRAYAEVVQSSALNSAIKKRIMIKACVQGGDPVRMSALKSR